MQELDMNNLPDLLIAKEVACIFRIAPVTVKRWVKSGKLKVIRVNTRGDMRFNRDDVLDLLKKIDK